MKVTIFIGLKPFKNICWNTPFNRAYKTGTRSWWWVGKVAQSAIANTSVLLKPSIEPAM